MAASKGNGEMATREVTGNVQRQTPVQRMIAAMAMDATMDADQANFTGDDITGILEAGSIEEMFQADQQGPLNFQHLAGCEIEVTSVQVKYGRNAGDDDIKTMFVTSEGKQMYLLVNAHRISTAGEKKDRILPSVGETFQANTSARFCVAKLWWLYTHGEIDADQGKTAQVTIQSTPLGDGRSVIKLTDVPQRSIQA